MLKQSGLVLNVLLTTWFALESIQRGEYKYVVAWGAIAVLWLLIIGFDIYTARSAKSKKSDADAFGQGLTPEEVEDDFQRRKRLMETEYDKMVRELEEDYARTMEALK